MDKQKLIATAKDYLQGGVGPDQVRELLLYRGIAPEDVDAVMRAAIAATAASDKPSAAEVVRRVGKALSEVSQEAPLHPDRIKKERVLIIASFIVLFLAAVVGSAVYYFYF